MKTEVFQSPTLQSHPPDRPNGRRPALPHRPAHHHSALSTTDPGLMTGVLGTSFSEQLASIFGKFATLDIPR